MLELNAVLGQYSIDDHKYFQGLSVFSLNSPVTLLHKGYVLLDEALADGTVEITEVSESGSVPELKLSNAGSLPVLVLDGEELVGAKQNRVANVTILAAGNATTVIPVSCVEAGRWGYRSPGFESSNRTHFAKGRAGKSASVSASMRDRGSRHSDQARVWHDVQEKAAAMSVDSATMSMGDIYDSTAPRLDEYVGSFSPRPGQTGAVFCVGAEIRGIECFDHAETLGRLYPKLIRSYALDAIEERPEAGDASPSIEDATTFLDRVASAATDQYPGVGLGTDIRLNAPTLVGGGLVHENRLLHLAAFADPDAPAGAGRRSQSALSRAANRRAAIRRRLRDV